MEDKDANTPPLNLRKSREDRKISVRAGLLSAAAGILAKEGPTGLTLRRLAAEVGASTKVVYTFFGGKSGLLEAVYLHAFAGLGDALAASLAVDDPRQRLWFICKAYRAYAHRNRELYGVMFGDLARGYEPPVKSRRQAWETFRTLRDTVRLCAPQLPVAQVDLAARTLWAVMHGVVSLELRQLLGGTSEGADQTFDHAVSAVCTNFGLANDTTVMA